jgi:formate dehydrogenase major subunit
MASRACYCQGEDIVQSDPNTSMWPQALEGDGVHRGAGPLPERNGQVRACVPAGLSFLEKDGTFTNAERRISRVRKVMPPLPAMPTGK